MHTHHFKLFHSIHKFMYNIVMLKIINYEKLSDFLPENL